MSRKANLVFAFKRHHWLARLTHKGAAGGNFKNADITCAIRAMGLAKNVKALAIFGFFAGRYIVLPRDDGVVLNANFQQMN